MATQKIVKTCDKGHQFYKSSDCPSCPVCEKERKPNDHFLSTLAAPARRALEAQDIKSLIELSQYTEKEILALHGMGKSSIPKLILLLSQEGLNFRE